jgi:YHS domain-containing protein
MRFVSVVKFSLLLLFALASCSAPSAPAGTEPVARKEAKKAAPKPKPYPLETCLVTGDDLDEMDERVSTVHDGQVFEFCCKPCLKKFHKNPGKYVKLLAKARD